MRGWLGQKAWPEQPQPMVGCKVYPDLRAVRQQPGKQPAIAGTMEKQLAGCSLVPGFLVGSLFTMYLASAQALLAGSKHRLDSSFKGYVYITVELWGLSGPQTQGEFSFLPPLQMVKLCVLPPN